MPNGIDEARLRRIAEAFLSDWKPHHDGLREGDSVRASDVDELTVLLQQELRRGTILQAQGAELLQASDDLPCEHERHPDFLFPVEIDYIGPRDPNSPFAFLDEAGEQHALIYTDGYVALTLYECCFAIWAVSDGDYLGGSLWKDNKWRLSAESREKIRKLDRDKR